ncbi:hypothetical protein GGP41_000385 [Bipolaris sorokiniana]|uniref:Uncharacterized protein n=1 Tax=Cochliobolus sativus TaxID=45130 RepID=A0A8H5ZE92_COCSA|nr:hypothetical protein GGP41_000385 [Bipolaris sorokiniana]
MAGPVRAITKHSESWLVLEMTCMKWITLQPGQNGLSIAFPTSCSHQGVSGMRENDNYGRAARASHVVTGTKMTPVAERWPELDFCSFPREQCLVTGSTCAYLVIARSNRPIVTKDACGFAAC